MKIMKDKSAFVAVAAIGAVFFMGYTNWQQANSNKVLSAQVDKLNTQLEQLNGKSAELQKQVDLLAQQLTPKPQQLVAKH
jgi:outer membrane murein-binding lipoprotein Lpp